MLRAVRLILLIVLLTATPRSFRATAQATVTPNPANIPYAGKSQSADLLDVYLPEAGTPPYPVVVMYTGSDGDKSLLTTLGVPQFVVEQDYAAVSVSYRGTLPNTYEDAYCALAWVYANAEAYDFDVSRIALYGVSWGGLTAAYIAAETDPAPYLTDCPNPLPEDSMLRGVITNSGAFLTVPDEIIEIQAARLLPELANLKFPDLQKLRQTLLSTSADQWCCLRFDDAVHNALQRFPVFHIHGDQPPFLIIQGRADTTVPPEDAENYAAILRAQGVDVQTVFDEASGHGVALPVYQDAMAAFLKRIFT